MTLQATNYENNANDHEKVQYYIPYTGLFLKQKFSQEGKIKISQN